MLSIVSIICLKTDPLFYSEKIDTNKTRNSSSSRDNLLIIIKVITEKQYNILYILLME